MYTKPDLNQQNMFNSNRFNDTKLSWVTTEDKNYIWNRTHLCASTSLLICSFILSFWAINYSPIKLLSIRSFAEELSLNWKVDL